MKKFIIKVMTSGSGVSSKRLFGAIGFICSIVFIGIWERGLTESLLIVSASLLGLETITRIFNKK